MNLRHSQLQHTTDTTMSIPVNLTRRITAAATTRAPIANKFSTAAAAAAAAAASPPCLLANTIRNNPKINNALSYRTSPPPQAQPHHVTRQITRQSSSHTHPTPTPTPTPTPSHNNPNHDPETTATYEPPPPPPPPEYFHHDYYSPYKPKRQWPPDMAKLSPKHQFRLERKYRRRAALKFARPKWVKGTKLVQWGMICCEFWCFGSSFVVMALGSWLVADC